MQGEKKNGTVYSTGHSNSSQFQWRKIDSWTSWLFVNIIFYFNFSHDFKPIFAHCFKRKTLDGLTPTFLRHVAQLQLVCHSSNQKFKVCPSTKGLCVYKRAPKTHSDKRAKKCAYGKVDTKRVIEGSFFKQ
jgi:hypothetical protein